MFIYYHITEKVIGENSTDDRFDKFYFEALTDLHPELKK